jgi:hypothetical protein
VTNALPDFIANPRMAGRPSKSSIARKAVAYAEASQPKATPYVAVDGKLDATPERLAKSNDNFKGKDGVRRFADSLLVRLAVRGGLYPDKDINRALLQAGERYYADWYGSNMSTLKAFDPTRVYTGSGVGSGMPANEAQAQMRKAHRKARAYLGKKYAEALELLVVNEQTDLVVVGKKIGKVAHERAARAIATERLTAGLFLLAKHYGYIA